MKELSIGKIRFKRWRLSAISATCITITECLYATPTDR
jgi:hypothetical protein